MASKMNMGESSKSSKVSKDRRVPKHVYKLTSQALGQGGDLTKDQTKGMACAVKLFDSPCLVTSSDVDCKNPFIMDRYSRRHSGETDYQLHNSSIINCLTFDSFSFLLLNQDISRRKQCIFELPLKVPSRDGTFHVHEFGKSCTLDPKQRELDTDYPLGSPIVQTTVTGSGTNQAVVGVVGRDKGKLCPFFINNEILDKLTQSLKDVSGPHAEEEEANGGGGPPKKHPTMHPDGEPNDGEVPADEQPVMQPEPASEKWGEDDTDKGKTSIEKSGRYGQETGSTPLEKLQQESYLKDTVSCNVDIMDELALRLDKAYVVNNREVPLKKHWVNLAEYFKVPLEIKLQCQQSSQNSPAQNLFDCLLRSSSSFPVARVIDCLNKIGSKHLSDMVEELHLPRNTELQDLYDNHLTVLQRIWLHLNVDGRGNWRDFGNDIKEISKDQLVRFANPQKCTETVLDIILTRRPKTTVLEIRRVLEELKRRDVCRELMSIPDNTSISVLLKDLDLVERIGTKLDDEIPGEKSWREFAQKFGVTRDECKAMRPEGLPSPTKELFKYLTANTPKLTIKDFLAAVVSIRRGEEVVEILKKFYDVTEGGILPEHRFFSPLNMDFSLISRSRFKHLKIPPLITRSYVVGYFVNFWVIFGYIWVEIISQRISSI